MPIGKIKKEKATPGANDWLVKLLAGLSLTYGPGEIDAARQLHVRCSQKVYPQKRKVMGYPAIPGALFDSSHRRRYVELNGPAALHRLPLFFVYLWRSGELWIVGAKWRTYVSHGLGFWRTKNKILGTQVCDSQTQITNLCLCNTNINLILGTLHWVTIFIVLDFFCAKI